MMDPGRWCHPFDTRRCPADGLVAAVPYGLVPTGVGVGDPHGPMPISAELTAPLEVGR